MEKEKEQLMMQSRLHHVSNIVEAVCIAADGMNSLVFTDDVTVGRINDMDYEVYSCTSSQIQLQH